MASSFEFISCTFTPYLNYGICAWVSCPLTFLNKLLVLQNLTYFAIPFFIESNCLPLQPLFFQQLTYFMYDVRAR